MIADDLRTRSVLTGIRILDLSMVLAGPFCTQILGDLGAEIIKIEPPDGDPTRRFGPYFYNGESAYFLSANRNKKSVVLDLKTTEGRQAFLDLASASDVVFDSYRPGVMGRLGIDHETLHALAPRLVTCSLTGFGSSGRLATRPAFDIVVQAMGGGMALTGAPDGEPMLMGLPVGDCLAGMFAAHGILAALIGRDHGQEGKHVDVSMLNSQVALLSCYAGYFFASGTVPAPLGARHPQNVPARTFKARDGYLAVYAALDPFFGALCAGIGRPELASDPRFSDAPSRRRNAADLEAELERAFLLRTVEEWEQELASRGVPVGPVYKMDQILDHPHVNEQNMVIRLDHPTAGPVRATGNPVKIDGVRDPLGPPPLLGEHTRTILGSVAGYPSSKVDRLVAEHAAFAAPVTTTRRRDDSIPAA